jgi:hypothetical protein
MYYTAFSLSEKCSCSSAPIKTTPALMSKPVAHKVFANLRAAQKKLVPGVFTGANDPFTEGVYVNKFKPSSDMCPVFTTELTLFIGRIDFF